jgi:hypothetical protein
LIIAIAIITPLILRYYAHYFAIFAFIDIAIIFIIFDRYAIAIDADIDATAAMMATLITLPLPFDAAAIAIIELS